MKLIQLLLALTLATIAFSDADAQTIDWPAGAADYKDMSDVTVTNFKSKDTVDLTIDNRMTYIKSDTIRSDNVIFNATDLKAKKGDLLYLELICDDTARTVKFGLNIKSDLINIDPNTKLVGDFIWNGTNYIKINTELTN